MISKKEAENILIVSLNENFAKRVSSLLAENLDMHSVYCHDMIVYDLINPKEVLEKCGLEYFQKRESRVVKTCASFLNTCISIDYDLFFKYHEFFENSLIIYLDLPYEKITKVPSIVDFNNRNLFLNNWADEIIKLDKKSCNLAINYILKKMGERYENS